MGARASNRDLVNRLETGFMGEINRIDREIGTMMNHRENDWCRRQKMRKYWSLPWWKRVFKTPEGMK